MVKCYLTGLDIHLHDAWVLNVTEAYKALKEINQQAMTIARLIEQLKPWDEIQIYDHVRQENINKKGRRLICTEIAKALSQIHPGKKLFLNWQEWKLKKRHFKENYHET
jgi:hypothetical protein